MIALIPARAGSKRVPGKNTRMLNGHPLIAYTIAAALESDVFLDVYVATESVDVMEAVHGYGASCVHRSEVSATDDAPDIVWVREVYANPIIRLDDSFAILRPTSPFRTAETIKRAFREFINHEGQYKSIRAVEPAKQTPFKMWELKTDGTMQPVIARCHDTTIPYHSSPTQSLPKAYIQNSSLEMSMTRNVTELGTIHGRTVYPFFTHGYEGLSIDTEDDWRYAEAIANGSDILPKVPARA
jgi:CMP-N,N'-diacetyllegionaminic acid synthase